MYNILIKILKDFLIFVIDEILQIRWEAKSAEYIAFQGYQSNRYFLVYKAITNKQELDMALIFGKTTKIYILKDFKVIDECYTLPMANRKVKIDMIMSKYISIKDFIKGLLPKKYVSI